MPPAAGHGSASLQSPMRALEGYRQNPFVSSGEIDLGLTLRDLGRPLRLSRSGATCECLDDKAADHDGLRSPEADPRRAPHRPSRWISIPDGWHRNRGHAAGFSCPSQGLT